MSSSRIFRLVTGAGVVVLLVGISAAYATGAGADGADPRRAERPNSPTSFSNYRAGDRSPMRAGDAIEATLDGLDRARFVSLALEQAPSPSAWQGDWVSVTVRATASEPPSIDAIWQADLAQGAIAERMAGDHTNLADVVRGSVIHVQGPNGKAAQVVGGAGDIAPGQTFGRALSDEELLNHAESVAARYGVDVTDVRLHKPLDRALSMVVRIPELKAFAGGFEFMRNDLFGDGLFEGIYLELTSGDGEPLLRSSTAYRSGAGRLWFEPGMDEVLGAVHGSVPKRMGRG